MAWPVPTLRHVQRQIKSPVWLSAVGGVFVMGVLAALVMLVWPIKHGSIMGGLFWVCLAGLPAAVCFVYGGLVWFAYGMIVHRCDSINASLDSMSPEWLKWARRSVVVKGTATLTAEANLAGKIAGLEGVAP
ncbi:hypothetical protein KDX01_27055 [Burkholderia vietnamiensis]|uniref:hypothetical protein n=1 Tax=Burkholderia vietnamiensis TaxID=60552 RepID=UPI001B9601BD|nr:hypothetical protein [Burkholderia vietnamiensis]MBR7976762.1 hypothetical protein [Burkholderia vietnamiensis]